MPYEIFERKTIRITDPAVSLTTSGRIALNATASRQFQKAAIEFVLMMWDKDLSKVAIRPHNKTRQARIPRHP